MLLLLSRYFFNDHSLSRLKTQVTWCPGLLQYELYGMDMSVTHVMCLWVEPRTLVLNANLANPVYKEIIVYFRNFINYLQDNWWSQNNYTGLIILSRNLNLKPGPWHICHEPWTLFYTSMCTTQNKCSLRLEFKYIM